MEHTQQTTQQLGRQADVAGTNGEAAGIDLFGLLSRHRLIIGLCMLLAGILGVVYYLSAERVYEAYVKVNIESSRPPSYTEEAMKDRQTTTNQFETHTQRITSPLILDRAFEEHNLGELSVFKDVEESQRERHWKDNLSIDVPEADSPIFVISYKGSSPNDCKIVVNAVVDTYEDYLKQKSEKLGADLTKLITDAEQGVGLKLDAARAEYSEFKKQSPLLWKDGEAVNIYVERQAMIEESRKDLLVEQSLLIAKTESVIDAIRRGGLAEEAMYYEALIELHLAEDAGVMEKEASRGYSTELAKEYVEVLTRERNMAERFASGHPDLIALRSRLKELRAAMESTMGRSVDSKDKLGRQVGTDEATKKRYLNVYRRLLLERTTATNTQLKSLNIQFDQAEKEAEKIQEFTTQEEELRGKKERFKQLYDAVVDRLNEINVVQNLGEETLERFAEARLGSQIWPSLPITGAFSILMGLMTGGLWSLLRETTRRVFNDPAEIRELLGVPILGQLPFSPFKNEGSNDESLKFVDKSIATLHRSSSRYAESHRGIRTALYFSTRREGMQVIQVTSPLPGDGKSTVIGNLAVSIAQAGKRVILIDADMRRPRLHKLFCEKMVEGLAEVVSGQREFDDVVLKDVSEDFDLLTSGYVPENPSELLSAPEFGELIERLRDGYDVVLIDTPPLLAVSDPSIVASSADGVMLVLRMRKGVRSTSQAAKAALDDVGANLLGVVVNAVKAGGNGYGYGSNYGYRSDYHSGYGYGSRADGIHKYYQGAPEDAQRPRSGNGSNGKKSRSPSVQEESEVDPMSSASNGSSDNGSNGNGSNGNGKSSNGNGKGKTEIHESENAYGNGKSKAQRRGRKSRLKED